MYTISGFDGSLLIEKHNINNLSEARLLASGLFLREDVYNVTIHDDSGHLIRSKYDASLLTFDNLKWTCNAPDN